MPKERWKVIESHPNYMVSNMGKVMNIRTGKFLKPYDDGKEYLRVKIDGRCERLHILVAVAFIPNPEGKNVVNHRGLKTFEGFMGNDIKESGVPFDIDRKLTEAEIAETVKYCRHDVSQAAEVFLERIDEFNTMMYFIKHFKLPISSISKTKPQLAAEILGGNNKGASFNDEFQFPILDCLRLKKYRHIADWYLNPENHDYSKSQNKVMVAGVEHTFSWGGGHGARKQYHAVGDFLIIDVTAYYPSLQKAYKFGYMALKNTSRRTVGCIK